MDAPEEGPSHSASSVQITSPNTPFGLPVLPPIGPLWSELILALEAYTKPEHWQTPADTDRFDVLCGLLKMAQVLLSADDTLLNSETAIQRIVDALTTLVDHKMCLGQVQRLCAFYMQRFESLSLEEAAAAARECQGLNSHALYLSKTESTHLFEGFEDEQKTALSIVDTLDTLAGYHLNLQTNSVYHERITSLEARFLYTHCGPWLLKAARNSAIDNALLSAASHITQRLMNADLSLDAFAWSYQWFELQKKRDMLSYHCIHSATLAALQYADRATSDSSNVETSAPAVVKADWEIRCNELKALRSELSENLTSDPQDAIQTFQGEIKTWLCDDIIAKAEALLGFKAQREVPAYCIMWLGSLSQGAMLAYSDLECALLVEQAGDARWGEERVEVTERAELLKALWSVIEFQIASLGEPEGLHIDDGLSVRKHLLLRNKPEALCQALAHLTVVRDSDDDNTNLFDRYALIHAIYGSGDQSLFDRYQKARDQFLNAAYTGNDQADWLLKTQRSTSSIAWHRVIALTHLRYVHEKVRASSSSSLSQQKINIKEPLQQWVQYLLLDVALYFYHPDQSAGAFDIPTLATMLIKAGILKADFVKALLEGYQHILALRCRQHIESGQQVDTIELDDALQGGLTHLLEHDLRPFYQAVPQLHSYGWSVFLQQHWQARLPQAPCISPTNTAVTVQCLGPKASLYLATKACQQVFTGLTVQPTDTNRNSAVFSLEGGYLLKLIKPDNPNSDQQKEALSVFVARQYAADRLAQYLSPDQPFVPAGCPVWVTVSAGGRSQSYAGWLCEERMGDNLKHAVNKVPSQISSIESRSLAPLVAWSFLVVYEDGHPRNLLLDEATQRLWIVDTKRCFVTPYCQVSYYFGMQKGQRLNYKSALCFLPGFGQTLHDSDKRHWLTLDAKTLAEAWWQDITALRTAMAEPLQQDARLLPNYLAYWLPAEIRRLQRALRNSTSLNTWLQHLMPQVYRHYQRLHQQHPGFKAIEEFTHIFGPGIYSDDGYSKSTAAHIKAHAADQVARRKSLTSLAPNFWQGVNFAEMSESGQRIMLELLLQQTSLSGALNLAGCSVLSDQAIEAILKNNRRLTALDISNCPLLTDAVFAIINRRGRKLTTLSCDNNPAFTHIIIELPALNELSCCQCVNLQQLGLKKAMPDVAVVVKGSPQKAVVDRHRYARTWSNKGVALRRLGRYEEALECYDKALALDQDYKEAWNGKGNALNDLGHYEEALECYDKALALDQDDKVALNNKGFALYKLGRHQEALECLDKALKLDQGFKFAWSGKGAALNGLGRYEEAFECCDKALKLDQEFKWAWKNKGITLYHLGRHKEALEYYNKALALDGDFKEALENKRIALQALALQESTTQTAAPALSQSPQIDEFPDDLPPLEDDVVQGKSGFFDSTHGAHQSLEVRIRAFKSSAHDIIEMYQTDFTMRCGNENVIHIALPAMNDPRYDVPLFASKKLLRETLQEFQGYLVTALGTQGFTYKINNNRLIITAVSPEKAQAVVNFLRAADCWFDSQSQQESEHSKTVLGA